MKALKGIQSSIKQFYPWLKNHPNTWTLQQLWTAIQMKFNEKGIKVVNWAVLSPKQRGKLICLVKYGDIGDGVSKEKIWIVAQAIVVGYKYLSELFRWETDFSPDILYGFFTPVLLAIQGKHTDFVHRYGKINIGDNLQKTDTMEHFGF